jgi:Golgi apparatus protein 1
VQGSARIIRCLQNYREYLGEICKATLSDQEIRMAEDIDFKFPMKVACTAEIRKFCGDKQHGEGNVIRCLQENQEETGMSAECKEEVMRETIRQSTDYR